MSTVGRLAILLIRLDLHRPEDFRNYFVRVGRIPVAELFSGRREQCRGTEDVRVFSKETENQPGEEMIHLLAPFVGIPVGISFQQFDIQPVQAAGGPDIERVFINLSDR